jgi:hypothetical protein
MADVLAIQGAAATPRVLAAASMKGSCRSCRSFQRRASGWSLESTTC